ncbi:MAG: signal peptidase II [Verrucomicrobiales bacterium]|nr:signal peptidase II [Verrucomicrobiales bacterium]
MKKYILFLTLPLYLLDQLSKWMVVRHFPHETFRGEEVVLIPNFFNLVRVHNTGMAFGMFNDSQYANLAFGTVAISALIAITALWRRNAFPNIPSRLAASLLISGILGNLTDRLMPGRGYVVDFLDVYIGSKHWPSFNVADSCISIAAVLLVISAFRAEPDEIKIDTSEK